MLLIFFSLAFFLQRGRRMLWWVGVVLIDVLALFLVLDENFPAFLIGMVLAALYVTFLCWSVFFLYLMLRAFLPGLGDSEVY